ncbi:hypothetical protein PMAYCL1PPCAC_30793, partial [Pristionchus mayeri]
KQLSIYHMQDGIHQSINQYEIARLASDSSRFDNSGALELRSDREGRCSLSHSRQGAVGGTVVRVDETRILSILQVDFHVWSISTAPSLKHQSRGKGR